MKKLLILIGLFINISIYSQSYNYRGFNAMLLNSLNDYKNQCYNDSTLEHIYVPRWNDSCYKIIGDMENGYDFILICKNPDHFEWIHKQPTFSGFIEWLEKQNKKQ